MTSCGSVDTKRTAATTGNEDEKKVAEESIGGNAGMVQILRSPEDQRRPWLNGAELLEDAIGNKHFLPTGCGGIDNLLGGGLRQGQLTEIVGPSSSGKTQICLQSAAYIADRNSGAVLFIDTCNSFSAHRISCTINQQSMVEEDVKRKLKGIMSNILCQSIFEIIELSDALHQIEYNLRHQVTIGRNQICLLIIDSISSLIAPILGGKNSQGRLLMGSIGFRLKKLAHEFNLAVLVTNHMVGGEGGALKPALGEGWKSIPHVRLLISRHQGSNICDISVLKHTILASGCTEKYVIHT